MATRWIPRAYPDLQEMMDDCRAAGLDPVICSSYRTQAKQQELYENKLQRLIEEGYSTKTPSRGGWNCGSRAGHQ